MWIWKAIEDNIVSKPKIKAPGTLQFLQGLTFLGVPLFGRTAPLETSDHGRRLGNNNARSCGEKPTVHCNSQEEMRHQLNRNLDQRFPSFCSCQQF